MHWLNHISLAGTLSLANTCLALNATSTTSNSSASTYVDPNVPTGVPIVGDYHGRYRPQIHYSPPQHFMNDPNGMFRDEDGTWHLYYQYNPTGNTAGNQHWGHATSKDLYHWVNQPIALFPPKKTQYIFSGSAVTDPNNTSGFFPKQKNGVVAIYTLAEYGEDGSAGPQTQAIAYSHDGGYTFTPYSGNPVIPSNSSQFRDPKVIRYGNHWVMVVAYAQDFEIGIFTSPDLKEWTHASNFSHTGLLTLQWECPNLVQMPHLDSNGKHQEGMWLLAISVNPGAPVGGSITQYYPGAFNGTHFKPVDSAARIADFGKDNYAGQFFYGTPENEPAVAIGWASNWQYTQVVPTGEEGWRSALSLPRRSYLTKAKRVGWKLVSEPYDLKPVMGTQIASNSSLVNGTLALDFSTVESNALYWEANITGIPSSGISELATLNFTFIAPQTGEFVRGGYYLGGDTPFYIDRGGVKGFDNVFFTDKFSTNSLVDGGRWRMSGVIDRSLLEVFLDGGIDSATVNYFATQPLTLLVLSTADLPRGTNVSVRVHALESAWQKMESERDGLVYGNQTTNATSSESKTRLFGASLKYKAAVPLPKVTWLATFDGDLVTNYTFVHLRNGHIANVLAIIGDTGESGMVFTDEYSADVVDVYTFMQQVFPEMEYRDFRVYGEVRYTCPDYAATHCFAEKKHSDLSFSYLWEAKDQYNRSSAEGLRYGDDFTALVGPEFWPTTGNYWTKFVNMCHPNKAPRDLDQKLEIKVGKVKFKMATWSEWTIRRERITFLSSAKTKLIHINNLHDRCKYWEEAAAKMRM